jgi:hypothetical protein
MIPMKPGVADRRRPSKAYMELTVATEPRSWKLVSLAAAVGRWSLDPREIGSLPINALAIALALKAGISDPNLGDT